MPKVPLRPLYQSQGVQVYRGDCLKVLPRLPAERFSAVVTDPPYGLKFMGKHWDRGVPGEPFWAEILRVAKPGAPLLAFGGTRTFHRLTCAIEDAGWEIRDCLMWVYGQGFPKSLDISKAIDNAMGAKRDKIQPGNPPAYQRDIGNVRPWMSDKNHKIDGPEPVTDATRLWSGWGTSLKPAWESIIYAQKPTLALTATEILGKLLVEHQSLLVGVDQWQRSMLRVSNAASFSRRRGPKSTEEGRGSVAVSAVVNPRKGRRAVSAGNVTKPSPLPSRRPNKVMDNSAATGAKQSGKPRTSSEKTTRIGKAEGSSAVMGMLPSELPMVNIDLNTMLCWRKCWEDLWKLTNSATTGTVIEAITDLRILNSLLFQVISENITRHSSSLESGKSSSAAIVGSAFIAASQKWCCILRPTAQEPAIEKPLRPNWEPIILAMKPLDGTYARNALKHGVAGLNVGGCRVGIEKVAGGGGELGRKGIYGKMARDKSTTVVNSGRWPANFVHDGSKEVVELFPNVGKSSGGVLSPHGGKSVYGDGWVNDASQGNAGGLGDSGSAARFFYCAKASRAERTANGGVSNNHPTVKPLSLMEWLLRMVTMPKRNLILDPFAGSGSTLVAAGRLGLPCVGIEQDEETVGAMIDRIEAFSEWESEND